LDVRRTVCYYNTDHFRVSVVTTHATMSFLWYQAVRAKLLVLVLNVPEKKGNVCRPWNISVCAQYTSTYLQHV